MARDGAEYPKFEYRPLLRASMIDVEREMVKLIFKSQKHTTFRVHREVLRTKNQSKIIKYIFTLADHHDDLPSSVYIQSPALAELAARTSNKLHKLLGDEYGKIRELFRDLS